MPHITALAAMPLVMAFLHRLRGGGFVSLPFKSTYVLWPVPGLLAWLAGAPWPVALAWAAGYFLWILPGWMVFLTRAVGAPVPSDQMMGSGWDVRLIDVMSFGNAALACFLRAAVFLVPLLIALACLDVFDGAGPLIDIAPLAVIVVAFLPAYLIGFAIRPTDMSSVAEPIVGFAWGLAMAGMLALA